MVDSWIGKVCLSGDEIGDNGKEFMGSMIKLKGSWGKGSYIKSIYVWSSMSKGMKIDGKSVEEK